jgi:peptide deformylase
MNDHQIKPHPEIVTGENTKILREPAKEIDYIDADIYDLIKKMRTIMHDAEGIGLAAPQIGIPLRIFVAEVDKKFYAILNPKIIKISRKKEEMVEGCLSLPGIYGKVKRPSKIIIEGLNPEGEKIKIKAWGLLARVFQHEIDHLNGVLFIDKAKELKRYEKD